MGDGSFFGFFLDLLVLIPVLLAIKAALPHPAVFRTASTVAGLYLLYAQAPRFLPFFIAYWVLVWLLQYLAARVERLPAGVAAKPALTIAIVIPLAPRLAGKRAPEPRVPAGGDAG
ncbi:hypothetical protein AB4144_51275, partial [Rhizobiaceae sp. 2RAB30]